MNMMRRVRVSTKSTGSKNIYFLTYLDILSDILIVANKNNIKFKYEKDSTDLAAMVFPTGSMDELKGELSGIKTMELITYSENPPHQMTLSWSPDNSASNDDDWLFPEIDITISSKGGVFTKENSDVPFPYNPGPDPSPSPEPVSPSPEPVSPSPEPVSPSPSPEPASSGKAWVVPVLVSLGALIVVIVIAALVVVYIIRRRKEPKSEISQANLIAQEV